MFAILIVLDRLPLTLLVACYRQRLGVGECLREAVLVASPDWAAPVMVFTDLVRRPGPLLRPPGR